MKITVLNGSPKGALSVTLQSVNFILKKFPGNPLTVHNVSQTIAKIEKNEAAFQKIIDDVASSDVVWWSVPIYVCLVPAQYKRFIELVWERGATKAFRHKYTAVFTTSIHFYDHTGNNYMHGICDDLEMNYVDFFSADMFDLMKEKERSRLLLFAENFFKSVTALEPTTRSYGPLVKRKFVYEPGTGPKTVDTAGKKVLLVADTAEEGTNLEKMVCRFQGAFTGSVQRVNLDALKIKGGCLGCIRCGFDNRCIYTGKDDFIDFYNDKVKTADILVYAGAIRDRYLSAAWKRFFDRRFFNTHIPTLTGKQVAFLISGPLGQETNLKEIFTALCELDKANLTGIVTDEFGDSAAVDERLQTLAVKLVRHAEKTYVKPETFLGIGGRKIFRDDIWSRLRFPFLADHQYYEAQGFYDFPQEEVKAVDFSKRMIEAIQEPGAREMIRKMLRKQLVAPHLKVVAEK